jgi:thiamine biosynthesis protein ThiC
MNLYVILRRDGWANVDQLAIAGARSGEVADGQMPDDIRWIRSYVLDEGDGAVGTVCIYQASSHEAIRRHAATADLPVTEIIPILDTVLVRPDPQKAGASAPDDR